VSNYQQDGHMAMTNPKGRANYEPNSWDDRIGPRESPQRGFQTFPALVNGEKVRARSETFADHYSQARQFFISQTEVEQSHIADALVFELSKVERADIRARVVSHLLNIDQGLANKVAEGLRLQDMPKAAAAAKPPRQDLKASPALSIVRNGPKSFAGRKVGVLVTDGADSTLLAALASALKTEGAMMKVVAPHVGGVKLSDGSMRAADHKIEGGPSVLFDAVVLLTSDAGVAQLATQPAARDFVADAFAHHKFVAHTQSATPLLQRAGCPEKLDAGFVLLGSAGDIDKFVSQCRQIRFWGRG